MARPASIEATPRQQEVLLYIDSFIRSQGLAPTVREIGAAFGVKSSSVFRLLRELQRKGYIERGVLKARALSLTADRSGASPAASVAVVGRIAAGHPIEALADDFGTLPVRADLLRGGAGFALQVAGDSMVEAGILDGDYVIIRAQRTADDGDIVVAVIDGEATLKRFYRDGEGVRLEPANHRLRAIHVQEGDFMIQGRLVGVVRCVG